MFSILFLAVTAFTLCLALTPLVRLASRQFGWLDQPGSRKVHTSPVPRTGGIAIAASYVWAVVLLIIVPLDAGTSVNIPFVLQLLPAAGLIFLIGLVDDLTGVRAYLKLMVQVTAALVAYTNGVHIHGLAGYVLPEWLSVLLTVVWLVGCSNAFNLIDGMDGLAAGIGLFSTFTILIAALLFNNVPLALATAPLCGALLAFLRYNFNPASIFMGDCGSLTLGFVLGCFGAIWSQKSATLLGMSAPLMALSVPLIDTSVTVVRRFMRRQPIFSPDRNHLHHRLLDRGLSPRRVALLIYTACALAATFSILQTMHALDGLLLVLFCVSAWAGIQLVGYAEFDVAKSLVVSGTFRDIVSARMFVESVEHRIRAARTRDDYWQAMRNVQRELGFAHLRMMLAGRVFEDEGTERPAKDRCSAIRIELGDHGYVNFWFTGNGSARHAIAIMAVVNILQKSIAARAADGSFDPTPEPRQPGIGWRPAGPGIPQPVARTISARVAGGGQAF